MDKDKKNYAKPKALNNYSNLILDPAFFNSLTSHRGINERQPLYNEVNKLLVPKKTKHVLKSYFLYPDRIPKIGREVIIEIMSNALILHLQKKEEKLRAELENIIDNKRIVKNKLNQIIINNKRIKIWLKTKNATSAA